MLAANRHCSVARGYTESNERPDSICCPARLPSHLFLATGRTSGATHSIFSPVAGEWGPRTNRTVEVVVGGCLRSRSMFDCRQRLVPPRKTLWREGSSVHLQNVDRTGLMRAPD